MNLLEPFSGCHTQADFFRVRISIENEWTPVEVAELRARREDLPERVRPWITELDAAMRMGAGQIQPFRRTCLAEDVLVFRGEAAPGKEKSLLVSFCGNALRLMMPTPVFLQHIPAERFDVVLFRDATRSYFLRGVSGYAKDMAELSARVDKDLSSHRYASIRCIGTSGGGAAALCAGVLLRAERAISVCGVHPAHRPDQLASLGLDGHEFDRLQRPSPRHATKMLCVFGAENESDREGSASLRKAYPAATLAALRGIGSHNVLYELLKTGMLGRFLDKALLGESGARSRRAG